MQSGHSKKPFKLHVYVADFSFVEIAKMLTLLPFHGKLQNLAI